jgi:hypothetical protein
MAWIESHQELGRHPKLLRLAAMLGISNAQAVGHLHYLWWWAVDYAPTGDLTRWDDVTIAIAAEWPDVSDPETFVQALFACGWLDNGRTLHDWLDYAGRLIERREANAQRMRERRATHVQRTDENVQDTSIATVPNLTVPTRPNQTEPFENLPPSADEEGFEEWQDTGNGMPRDQIYLLLKLAGADAKWSPPPWSLVAKLNRDVGRQYVTETLRRLVETPNVSDPRGALVAISEAVKAEAS